MAVVRVANNYDSLRDFRTCAFTRAVQRARDGFSGVGPRISSHPETSGRLLGWRLDCIVIACKSPRLEETALRTPSSRLDGTAIDHH